MSTRLLLPLFPLGVVLYPRERLPLHIFEPRYREMVRYCREEDVPFGVILLDDDRMAEVGCSARIRRVVQEYRDGRMDIMVRGEERFRILERFDDRPYPTAEVETLAERRQPLQRDLKERAITQHMKLLELAGRTVRPSVYEGIREVSFVMAHNAGLTLRQKQTVLELPSENERIAYLVDHFEGLIPRVEEMEDLKRKLQSNGHFPDFEL